MKPSIQLHLNQQLSLTPQLQQAIRLLQLSQLELSTELRQITEANPMLEFVEDGAPEDPREAKADGEAVVADDGETAWDTDPGTPDTALDFSQSGNTSNHSASNDWEPQNAAPEGLREHLMWQLNLSPLDARERMVATVIIDALDTNGYLHESLAALATALPAELHIDEDQIETVRRQVQQFDPAGVASTSLADCLDAQLRQFGDDTPHLELARRIVADELDLLARNNLKQIASHLHADAEAVATACGLIRSLDPHPGAALDPTPVEYVIPDAYVRRDDDGRWHVSLSPSSQPKLELNQHYCGLIKQVKRDDAVYLRGQLQEARWLLKSLEARADTVLKVARAIVQRQRAFLDYGPEAMRPLVLREIAEEIDMHESTISRVTTRKYLHTPRGIFEFKYFFSSSVGTEGGGSASSTAIQAMVRKLVDEENPRKPLSDQALANALGERGIHVARRTIAKYRDALRIPGSSERRRAG
ncbi:MAG TPA: RNA polymerase factor sigma-54 [Oleiagrimonas sp.]|nr:RNA polymerase factor sigma-54 [Oleiagrimonas sp.]